MVNLERKEALERYVSKYFSIGNFLENLPNVEKNEVGACTCPFHGDEVPSLFFNEDKQIWFCHSCRRGGGVLNLYRFVNSKNIERPISYSNACNMFIKEYNLSSILGFKTITEEIEFSSKKISELLPPPRRVKRHKILTSKEYISYIIKVQEGLDSDSEVEKILKELDSIV